MSNRRGRWGKKPVRHRRDDALSRVDENAFEVLIADYYRGQGFQVDHCGANAIGRVTDGGVDIRLRRDSEQIIVQCKHWNVFQIPHNDVHELLGIKVREGAAEAIFITSGEFTDAAKRVGGPGLVTLIDGDAVRAMLGPLLPRTQPKPLVDREYVLSGPRKRRTESEPAPGRSIEWERVGDSMPRRRKRSDSSDDYLIGLVLTLAVVWAFVHFVQRAASKPYSRPEQSQTQPRVVAGAGATARQGLEARDKTPARVLPTPRAAPVEATKPRQQTEAEIRESQRKADEAVKVLAPYTPEM